MVKHPTSVTLLLEGKDYPKRAETIRTGVTLEMAEETDKHLQHAIACLEVGLTGAKEGARTRNEYPACEYTRMNLWGYCEVLCYTPDYFTYQRVSLNDVNECTTAQEIIELVWFVLGRHGFSPLSDDDRKDEIVIGMIKAHKEAREKGALAAQGLTHNAPQSHETGRSSDLQSSQVSTIQDGDYCGAFDSRKKDEYRAAVGKTLAFDIAKIHGVLEDGVEKWELYSTLANGNAAQYPFTRVYGDNQYIAETIAELRAISQPGGKAVEGSWIGAFKIAVKGDKIYYNMQALKDKEVVF